MLSHLQSLIHYLADLPHSPQTTAMLHLWWVPKMRRVHLLSEEVSINGTSQTADWR